MTQPDVVLIHPPSVFDFRERTIFYGPISDVIPSSPVFEMYPVGFLTLSAYLRRHGYRVRIINLALLMMRSRRFRPERFLKKLKPALFGIDLHWLPHAHGGPAVAALLKKLHPDIPIVFGGISSSYFHEELIRDDSVDFVLRGSVTEPALLALVRELKGERRFERVPGLTWKSHDETRVNAEGAVATLDDCCYDLGTMVAGVTRHLDFWSTAPFHTWWHHPITAVFTVRGCGRGCVTCGASHAAFQRFMPGRYPLLRSPASVVSQVRQLAELTRAPIFLVGDLRDGGEEYARAVLDALARTPVNNRIVFEFFDPPSPDYVARIDASIRHWGAELSPESHDQSVRARLGKARFTNEKMEESIAAMLALRCENLDLFYMIGLPGQTYDGVLATVAYIEQLFIRHDRRLSAFVTPMGPFIDPGSNGFESAEQYGYIMRAHTLAEHRALLEQRDWESILNYETHWMTRTDIVDATYDAGERLNELKRRYGRITEACAAGVSKRLGKAREIRRKLSENGQLDSDEVRAFSEGTINDKAELFAPGAFLRNFRISGILQLLARQIFAIFTSSASPHEPVTPPCDGGHESMSAPTSGCGT
ncbi:MAG TPA: TIGR04190 family B12-binding domain/radical SAM domain protein [Thermoanaerobaculia bacterium]|nr:TIGR04190 family B12-binding domain/radical SAM domain protein [Thermoanaerobaculia bacterium]